MSYHYHCHYLNTVNIIYQYRFNFIVHNDILGRTTIIIITIYYCITLMVTIIIIITI